MENLYSLVNKTVGNDTKLSKVQFGYTVDTYNGVLEALYNAKLKLVQKTGAGGTTSGEIGQGKAIWKRWTELSSIEIGGVVSGDGFVVGEGNDYEKYRQQQVIIQPYMPFVVERDKDGKRMPYYVPYVTQNARLDTIGQAASGKHTLPVKDMDPEKCKSFAVGLGSISNPFEIGIAVDLEEGGTADTFFEKCYNKIYSKGCAAKLARIHALYAEVAFPHSGNADAVNIRVSVNKGVSEDGKAHTIYFPLPLLLTNTFNTLGQVKVNFGDKWCAVGESDCSYPFANSKFSHLDATLDGYTPQYVKDIVGDSSRVLEVGSTNCTVSYESQTYSLGSGEGCYIRFYIDKEKEAEALKVLEKDSIPEEYQNEIFRGKREAKMFKEIIGYEQSGGGYGSLTAERDFWTEVGKSLINPLTTEQVIAAVNVQGKWESGGQWDKWIIGKDSEGVSAGKFQCTQRAGGIRKWKKHLLKRGGTISPAFADAIDKAVTGSEKGKAKGEYAKLTRSDAEKLFSFGNEFAEIANTRAGILAQLDVWKEEKGDKTIEIYNMFNCSTAAEFSALFGAVNHHPIIKKNYTEWKGYLQDKTGAERARVFENIHWAAIANYYCNRSATPNDITASYIRGMSSDNGNGWANRFIDVTAKYKTMG